MNKPQQRRRKGEAQVRQEPRSGGKRWGDDITLRQDSGKRKRFRDFSFHSEQEAKKSLAALIVAGNKGRYGLIPAVKKRTLPSMPHAPTTSLKLKTRI